MTTIMPQSELTRKAVTWISEMLRDHPEKKLPRLVEEAAQRFNLSPKDSEFLLRFFKNSNQQRPAGS